MMKRPGTEPLALTAILILAILLSGCLEQIEDTLAQSNDPVIRRSAPYTRPIDPENATLRSMVVSAVGQSGDRDYQINQVYRYVVEHYSYYSDPRSRDYIQLPYETIAMGGGDCEDLSILLCSLLENLGIRTYLVLTDSHAYCLASAADLGRLKGYAQQSMLEQLADDYNAKNDGGSMVAAGGRLYRLAEESEAATVRSGYVLYYGGNGSRLEDPVESVDWEYEVEASAPITIYLVPSGADYEAICQDRPFSFCPGTMARNVLHTTGSYRGLGTNGGLVLKNDGRSNAAVTIRIKKYTNYATDDVLKNMRFTTYTLDNQTCVVLDPTAGKFGYPGFSSKNETGERIAIDPVTRQYYYLG